MGVWGGRVKVGVLFSFIYHPMYNETDKRMKIKKYGTFWFIIIQNKNAEIRSKSQTIVFLLHFFSDSFFMTMKAQ